LKTFHAPESDLGKAFSAFLPVDSRLVFVQNLPVRQKKEGKEDNIQLKPWVELWKLVVN